MQSYLRFKRGQELAVQLTPRGGSRAGSFCQTTGANTQAGDERAATHTHTFSTAHKQKSSMFQQKYQIQTASNMTQFTSGLKSNQNSVTAYKAGDQSSLKSAFLQDQQNQQIKGTQLFS